MGTSQERRPCRESNATWTGPLSEAMPACRGRRADHAQKDRIGTWEIPVRPEQFRFWSASGRENRKPMMNERGKSDPAVVAMKLANKAERSVAEPVEPRAGTKGNANQQDTGRTQSRETVSQVLARIRQTARERKKERFTALFHHINVELLRDAFFTVRREAAPGVDGVTWQDYEANVETNLQDLHARVQRGAYRALPSRRRTYPSRMAGSARSRSRCALHTAPCSIRVGTAIR